MPDPPPRPYALMRHHAGWADVFHIETETDRAITGRHPDRDPADAPATYNVQAVLARFDTLAAARAAREAALAEWRRHDEAVRTAEAHLRQAEKVRENAWLARLRESEL